MTRGLAPTPVHHHMQVDIGVPPSKAANQGTKNGTKNGRMGAKKKSGVHQAGYAQTADIGYDIEGLYEAMYNPTVSSKDQTVAQQPGNVDMAENRLGTWWW